MSDTTDEARRLNNQPIRYQPPREVIDAMLDVIDAAEAHGHANEYWERDEGLDGAARLMEADAELRNSIARFREVASGSKPFSSDQEADRE